MTAVEAAKARLARFSGFLAHDPQNVQLLADAASAAQAAGEWDQGRALIDRALAIEPASPVLQNLSGMIAIGAGRLDEAAAVFEALRQARPDDMGVAYNLAWTRYLQQDWEGALSQLSDEAAATLPQAATLRVQALHRLGRLDEALELGAGYAAARPDDADLMTALAIAAIDDEKPDLARGYALRSGGSHEGLATLGLLDLDLGDVKGAETLFDRAINVRADSARGLMGKGLCVLLEGEPLRGAAFLDQSAEAFGSHIGTWIAAGWAYLTAGDYARARERFDRAMALDDRFGESHGSLAVLDIIEGDLESAKRRAEVALRLDRNSMSAALARSLLAERAGDTRTAERIRQIALNTPLGADGRTIANALTRFGARGSKL